MGFLSLPLSLSFRLSAGVWDMDSDRPHVKKQEEVEVRGGGVWGEGGRLRRPSARKRREKNTPKKEASTDSGGEMVTLSCSG